MPSREEARLARTASFLLDHEVDWSREATRVWVDGIDGTVEADLPTSSLALLVRALHEMRIGQGTDIVPYRSELTTQQAADLLGVSRPHVVKLLESGVMPFWKVGNRRRVLLEDVLAYHRAR